MSSLASTPLPMDKFAAWTALAEGIGSICPPQVNATLLVEEDWQGIRSVQRWCFAQHRFRQDVLQGPRIRRTFLAQYDKRQIHLLWSLRDCYQTMTRWKPFPQFDKRALGSERVAGEMTQHWECVSTNLAPLMFKVDAWLTHDQIPVRVEVHVLNRCDGLGAAKGDLAEPIVWNAVDVERAPLDASIFELPADAKPRHLLDKPVFNVGDLMKNTTIQHGRIGS